MATLKDELRTWMSFHKLTLEQAAEMFGVEKQTVANWRSAGVPVRRAPHVRAVMDKYPMHGGGTAQLLNQPLLIQASRDQFRRWNAAAVREGKLIEDWAIEGLDQLAAEWEGELHSGGSGHLRPDMPVVDRSRYSGSMLNEDPPPYGGKAGSVPPPPGAENEDVA